MQSGSMFLDGLVHCAAGNDGVCCSMVVENDYLASRACALNKFLVEQLVSLANKG